MEIPKRPSVVRDDRPGAPHVDHLAHTGFLASRDAGSPGVPTELASTRSSLSRSCARMNESALRQLFSEAAPDRTASYEELPRLILGTNDRNPGETQPRASNTTDRTVFESPTSWRLCFDKWTEYFVGLVERKKKAAGT